MSDDLYFDESVISLKGIGDKSAGLLNKLGIFTLHDLICYYPKTYLKYSEPIHINAITEGETISVRGIVKNNFFQKKFGHLQVTTVSVEDETGTLHLTFFNLNYLRKLLAPGSVHVFRGIAKKKGTNYCLEQPEIIKPEEYERRCTALQPVYSLCKGLSSNAIRKAVLQTIEQYGLLNENHSDLLLNEYHLVERNTALKQIHFPANYDSLHDAKKRIIFDEFYEFLSEIKRRKELYQAEKSDFICIDTAQTKRFEEMLPYRLTNAQQKALNDIKADMTGGYVTNRLVQGDVGSGKTIIAFICMLLSVTNGYQCAFMAPTEVLAVQHYQSLMKMNKQYHLDMDICLLTGSMTQKQKQEAYDKIESGLVNAVIGTHALFQEKVSFNNLALVITDEQHRFGVNQRAALSAKSKKPHVIVMSATPIPRTLASVLYSDLQVSIIDELPANRIPIKNCVVDQSYRETAYKFIEKQVNSGHQAYIVCPMVEESEWLEVESVKEYAQKLKEYYQGRLQIGILHGQMKPEQKNTIMNDFADKKIDILVATTVIEVGINVTNATVMMVENAERFGLAQLHQLRGRVGRGEHQSYCIFVATKNEPKYFTRLKVLNESNDGFYIANEDLKMRGPGDLFGIRQSGAMNFQLADIYMDQDILLMAQDALNKYGTD